MKAEIAKIITIAILGISAATTSASAADSGPVLISHSSDDTGWAVPTDTGW